MFNSVVWVGVLLVWFLFCVSVCCSLVLLFYCGLVWLVHSFVRVAGCLLFVFISCLLLTLLCLFVDRFDVFVWVLLVCWRFWRCFGCVCSWLVISFWICFVVCLLSECFTWIWYDSWVWLVCWLRCLGLVQARILICLFVGALVPTWFICCFYWFIGLIYCLWLGVFDDVYDDWIVFCFTRGVFCLMMNVWRWCWLY